MMKQIPGFPGYQVTDDGRVWSETTRRWRAASAGFGGYPSLDLWLHGRPYRKLVHRLVLEAFVGPCPEGMEGCHSNGNPRDNRLSNLRWDTRTENHRDAVKHGTMPTIFKHGEAHPSARLTQDVVDLIRSYSADGVCNEELAIMSGVTSSQISHIIHNRTWVSEGIAA